MERCEEKRNIITGIDPRRREMTYSVGAVFLGKLLSEQQLTIVDPKGEFKDLAIQSGFTQEKNTPLTLGERGGSKTIRY